MFAFDVATGQKLWEVTPAPGDRVVSSLAFGPDGNLWGLTGGRVFRLDPATGAATVIATVTPYDWGTVDHYWREGALRYHEASGTFYGTARGTVFSLDPHSGVVTTHASGTSLFLSHSSGRMYWTKGFNLVEATG